MSIYYRLLPDDESYSPLHRPTLAEKASKDGGWPAGIAGPWQPTLTASEDLQAFAQIWVRVAAPT